MIKFIKVSTIQSWYILIICLLITTISFSQDQSKSLLFRTETKILHSNINGRDYEIYISFPVDYYQNDTTSYPVLYCTDGNYAFNLVSGIVNVLTFPRKEIPRVLVVCIGYKIKELKDWLTNRKIDLLPNNDSGVGGASKFLSFIGDELIPYIESNYRVKQNDRTLMGYSFGGLFSLFAMFSKPEIFQGYYAGSPSIWWDNKVIFNYEKEYADTHKDLHVNLFMSIGSLEDKSSISDMYEMAARLESRNYPNLKLETHIFEGETHSSCIPGGVSTALKTIFK
jgi:predicted alpha/beta superfamily hydrolase